MSDYNLTKTIFVGDNKDQINFHTETLWKIFKQWFISFSKVPLFCTDSLLIPLLSPSQSYKRSLISTTKFSSLRSCILVLYQWHTCGMLFNGHFQHCFLPVNINDFILNCFPFESFSLCTLAIFLSSRCKRYFCLAPFTLWRCYWVILTSSAFKANKVTSEGGDGFET